MLKSEPRTGSVLGPGIWLYDLMAAGVEAAAGAGGLSTLFAVKLNVLIFANALEPSCFVRFFISILMLIIPYLKDFAFSNLFIFEIFFINSNFFMSKLEEIISYLYLRLIAKMYSVRLVKNVLLYLSDKNVT